MLSIDQKQVIQQLYGKKTYKEIGDLLGVTACCVKGNAARMGITRSGIGKSPLSRRVPLYVCNEEFFSNKSLESIYWAGFIAADGCIRDDQKNLSLAIALQVKDFDHLLKFKEDVGFTGNVKTYNGKYTYKGIEKRKQSCSMSIVSNKLCSDLARLYNITPRKSLTYKPPIWLNKEQFLYFLKGYIDGDGSIAKPNYSGYSFSIQLLGTEELLTWVVMNIEEYCGVKVRKKAISKRGNIHSLLITHKTGRAVLSELSKLGIGLGRKWDGVGDICTHYKDPRIVLSKQDVCVIRRRLMGGEIQKTIANDYGVHQMTISNVKLRKPPYDFTEDEETIN